VRRCRPEGALGLIGELEAALVAAKSAGEVLRDGIGGHRRVRYKGEVDLATEMESEPK
jgi:hypothetical protein